MKIKCLLLTALLLAFASTGFAQSKTKTTTVSRRVYSAGLNQQSAINRAVQNYIARNSAVSGRVRITKTDVQGAWAHVWAEPRKRNLDSVQLLLRKQGKGWKVLVMGTSLFGTGKQYGVPNRLRKKWNL